MDQLSKFGPIAALSGLWKELNATQRVVVTAFAALSIVTIVIIGMVASKPRMAVLFSRLEPEDAGAIVQKLSEQKVSYKLSADNSTIEVPASQVDDLRLTMTSAGLPQGGNVGFELFDKSNFGMTEFDQRIKYKRAIQGELTRTIEHLAPVTNARVQIAIPEDKLYESEQEPAKASVFLHLKRGMTLSDEQVGGIIHLVSSAVEGLEPSHVEVIDSTGRLLSDPDSSNGGRLLTNSQTRLKRQYENELAQNIQSMLTRIVGRDKAVVRVSVDMSFDQKQMKSESYEPASTTDDGMRGVLVSEEKKSEEYAGAVVPPGGVPNNPRERPGSPSDNYLRSETTAQYQVTKKIEEVVSAPGEVKRLSVAVLVDDKVAPAKISTIREAVIAAAGINLDDKDRNDQVTVESIAFDDSAKEAEEKAIASESKSEMIRNIIKTGGAVLLLIVFLVFLRLITRQIRIQMPAPPQPQTFNAVVGEDESIEQPFNISDLIKEHSSTTDISEDFSLNNNSDNNFSTAAANEGLPKEIAQSSPDDLARLVRTWMSEQ